MVHLTMQYKTLQVSFSPLNHLAEFIDVSSTEEEDDR